MNIARKAVDDTENTTVVRLSGADWVKVLCVVFALMGTAFSAHLQYTERFARIEERQAAITKTQTEMSSSHDSIAKMAATVEIIASRQLKIEDKLDKL